MALKSNSNKEQWGLLAAENKKKWGMLIRRIMAKCPNANVTGKRHF